VLTECRCGRVRGPAGELNGGKRRGGTASQSTSMTAVSMLTARREVTEAGALSTGCDCYGDEDLWDSCMCRGPNAACDCSNDNPGPCNVLNERWCINSNTQKCRPDCSNNNAWPAFQTEDELKHSPWEAYFKNLYGEKPSQYPLELSQFWCFYTDKMSAARVTPPPSVGKCPTSSASPEGQLRRE